MSRYSWKNRRYHKLVRSECIRIGRDEELKHEKYIMNGESNLNYSKDT